MIILILRHLNLHTTAIYYSIRHATHYNPKLTNESPNHALGNLKNSYCLHQLFALEGKSFDLRDGTFDDYQNT